jgi:hypothetical protein
LTTGYGPVNWLAPSPAEQLRHVLQGHGQSGVKRSKQAGTERRLSGSHRHLVGTILVPLLWRDRPCRRQYGHPDGRLVPQGDQDHGRSGRPEVSDRGYHRRDPSEDRRGPATARWRRCVSALEKGTIDAAEWVGPYDDEKLGLQKVVKFYYYPGFWEAGPMLHVMTNLEKRNSLPKYYQTVLANAAAHANIWMSARYDLVNPAALQRLVATGTQLRPFSNEIMEACLKATNELWTEISAKNADFKKSIEAMQAYRNDQYLWWQVAEYTNDSFMIRSRSKS